MHTETNEMFSRYNLHENRKLVHRPLNYSKRERIVSMICQSRKYCIFLNLKLLPAIYYLSTQNNNILSGRYNPYHHIKQVKVCNKRIIYPSYLANKI